MNTQPPLTTFIFVPQDTSSTDMCGMSLFSKAGLVDGRGTKLLLDKVDFSGGTNKFSLNGYSVILPLLSVETSFPERAWR